MLQCMGNHLIYSKDCLGLPGLGRVNFKHKHNISGVEMSVTSFLKLLETQLEVVINTN